SEIGLTGRERRRRSQDTQGGWSPGTLSARQPGGETRAPTTLVEAVHHAAADVGSIPTVSTPDRTRAMRRVRMALQAAIRGRSARATSAVSGAPPRGGTRPGRHGRP